MGVLAAERIKLTSTRSPWWCTAVIVVLGLGFAALGAIFGKDSLTLTNALGGVSGFGVLVLMIMAALAVTSEYRFGTIRSTFLATPARDKVLVTKAVLIGVFGAVLIGVLSLLAFGLAKVIAGSDADLLVLNADTVRGLYGVPVYAFLAVLFAIGVGVLVRQTAAAVSIVILLPTVLETLLSVFGSFGRNVGAFMPFQNASRFYTVGQTEDITGINWHWGPWGSLVYFAAFVAIVFGAALFMVNKRDA
ncbi:ABC transporter permease [Nocardia sp. NPDC005978]|uniref:ABC transporter permease n=1 Tax=unclassified Nocardia TaxID=2637762 RepID=UPI0033B1E336